MSKMQHVTAPKGKRNANDYYPTAPVAVRALQRNYEIPQNIFEPAAGRGWISSELESMGYTVHSRDLYEYENPLTVVEYGHDFLKDPLPDPDFNIQGVITNPPYGNKMPLKFIERSIQNYDFTAMFCRLSFLETATRGKFFTKYPMAKCMIMGSRIQCNEKYFHSEKSQFGGMISYAWFIWDNRVKSSNEMIFVDAKDYVQTDNKDL